MLTDKLTARVLAGLLLVFPFLMGGASIFITSAELRSQKLFVGMGIMSLPLWAAGIALMLHARKLKD